MYITSSGGGKGAEMRGAIMEGLAAGDKEKEDKKKKKKESAAEKGPVREIVKVESSLETFELKLFKNEPSLVSLIW